MPSLHSHCRHKLLTRTSNTLVRKPSFYFHLEVTCLVSVLPTFGSRVTVVGIVTWLQDGRFGVRISAGAILQNAQTGSRAHPASYSVGTGGCFLWVKRSGLGVNHSPSPSIGVKDKWSYTSIRVCFGGVDRGDFILFLF